MTKEEFQLKKMALAVKGVFASALLLFGVAAVLYSAGDAHASDAPSLAEFVSEKQAASGKYRMQYTPGLNKNGDFFWHTMIYNTETGRANFYYWDRKGQRWAQNFSGKQMPQLP